MNIAPNTATRRLLALLVLLAAFPPACAAGLHRSPAQATVALELVDREHGQALPRYVQHGRAWVPGVPGHRYAVRLHNQGARRVLVVLSVDGVNAVSGQSADPRQAGYVLEPWQSLEVTGWRKSLAEVAGFVFVDPAASYAARTGRPDDIGVIGIAVFHERRPVMARPAGIAHPGRDESPSATADAATARQAAKAFAAASAPGLGTGHGDRENAPAYRTRFDREPAPAQVVELRYDTADALLARGVMPGPRRASHPAEPRAFPGFVPDPPCCAVED